MGTTSTASMNTDDDALLLLRRALDALDKTVVLADPLRDPRSCAFVRYGCPARPGPDGLCDYCRKHRDAVT